jgi:hypothetical protein
MITMMRNSFNQYELARTGAGDPKGWIAAWNRVNDDIPGVLVALRREFRTTLSISE